MKDDNAAFTFYMDRTWPNWKRELNGQLCERVRLAFLAGAEAERKEMETGKCHEGSDTPSVRIGSSTLKRPSKASSLRKIKRGKSATSST